MNPSITIAPNTTPPNASTAPAPTPVGSPPGGGSNTIDVADSDSTQSFGAMLSVEIDAAALLGDDAAAATAAQVPTEAPVAATIDPATLSLQLSIPPVQAAPVMRDERTTASEKTGASAEKVSLASIPLDSDSDTSKPALKTSPEQAPRFVLPTAAATEKNPVPQVAPAEILAVETKPAAGPNDSTQALAALHGTQAPSRAPEPVLKLAQPIGSERWNNELGQTVHLLIQGDQTRASLHVTPPEMGPIEIKIDLSGDKASINFSVQQSDTRIALENAMPRLREILGEAGITLGQSQINQQSAEQRQAQNNSGHADQFGNSLNEGEDTVVQVKTRIGLVDTFA